MIVDVVVVEVALGCTRFELKAIIKIQSNLSKAKDTTRKIEQR